MTGLPVAPCDKLLVEFSSIGDGKDENLKEVLPGKPVRLYHGTAECSGFVRFVERLTVGESVFLAAQIALPEPVIAEPGDKFVLRYGDDGLTGGTIILNR